MLELEDADPLVGALVGGVAPVVVAVAALLRERLDKTSDLFSSLDVSAIAKEADAHGIVSLVELVAAAAVQCEKRGEIVPRIMTMSASGQVEMKAVIEDSMGQLQDRQGGDDDDGNDEDDIGSGPGGEEIEFDSDDYNSDDDGDPSKSMSAMFTAAEHDIDAAMADLDGEAAAISGSPRGSGGAALAKERDESNDKLAKALADLESEVKAHNALEKRLEDEEEKFHQAAKLASDAAKLASKAANEANEAATEAAKIASEAAEVAVKELEGFQDNKDQRFEKKMRDFVTSEPASAKANDVQGAEMRA